MLHMAKLSANARNYAKT